MFKKLGMFDRSLGMFQPPGSIPFQPGQLFAAGEQGVWYDPSDFSTMFQNSAGTTPVTAIEQPVGLILDKSGRGNNATQSTTTSRPILRNLYNLLTYTEDFSNAVWTSTLNGVIKSVNAITDQATTAYHGIYYTLSLTAATSYTVSFKVKKGTVQYITIGFYDNASLNCGAGFNLNSGTVTGTGAIGAGYSATNARVVDAGGGVYICSVDCTKPSTTSDPAILHRSTAYVSGSIAESYLGAITNTTTIYTASLVPTNEASIPYQRVVTNTLGSGVYDTDLTKFPPYLFFDGSDDSLQTANIDFSATDKMSMFVGMRKLSDIVGCVAEFSASVSLNNGSWYLFTPVTGLAPPGQDGFASKGSQSAIAIAPGVGAPLTSVMTGLGSIPAMRSILRRNSVQVALSTDFQGTGNYGNYPIYIGSRGGTTLLLTGRIYSLIVRGALTSSPQLEQTERWVAAKTGVTL